MSDEPKTVAEQLDAARTAAEFGSVLERFFKAVERERYAEEGTDG